MMTGEYQSSEQRRLWLLQRLLEKMDADKALDLAARMEKFVSRESQTTARQDDGRYPAAENALAELDRGSSPLEPRPPARSAGDCSGRLLSAGELQAFIDRAVQGATNRDLARLFGLTPRQANGIRMALAKRMPQVALRSSCRLNA
jgi:hypothetical protein